MVYYWYLFKEIMFLKKPKPLPFSQYEFGDPVIFPYMNSPLHNGFANSTTNEWGLQAQFYHGVKGTVFCVWKRTLKQYQGFSGIVHGGILATLADELMANGLVANLKKFGVSLSSKFQWHHPVRIGDVVYGKAQICSKSKAFVYLKVMLKNEKDQVVLTGHGLYYLPTEKQFKKMTNITLPEELMPYLRG